MTSWKESDMKRCLTALILVGALTGFAFAGGGDEHGASKTASNTQAADKTAIETLWNDYSRFVVNHDAEGYLNLHDRGAYKMPQDQPMFQLWAVSDKIKAKFAKGAQEYNTEMRINPKEIVVMGDYAYTMGTYYKADTPKTGGAAIVVDGKFLTILHKDSSGKWKILRDCYNSNVPPS